MKLNEMQSQILNTQNLIQTDLYLMFEIDTGLISLYMQGKKSQRRKYRM